MTYSNPHNVRTHNGTEGNTIRFVPLFAFHYPASIRPRENSYPAARRRVSARGFRSPLELRSPSLRRRTQQPAEP